MNLLLKVVEAGDVSLLRDISIKTFTEAFSSLNSAENMSAYLTNNLSLAKLSDEIKTPGSVFYLAMLDDETIGYLKLNTGSAQTELKTENSLEIERIYVRQAYLGKNVGRFLYENAVRVAKEMGADFIWLGVWEENHRAISFYAKNGFVQFDKHLFRLGDDVQTDIMMKKVI